MLAKTHIISSAAIAVPIFYLICPDQQAFIEYLPIIAGSIAIGAVFPDIDEPNSRIGRALYPISRIVSLFIRHRTITHSLVIWGFIFILTAFLWFFTNIPSIALLISFGIAGGCVLHILGDAMTCAKVTGMFYPFNIKPVWIIPSFMRFNVGSPLEYAWLAVFTLLLAGFFAWAGGMETFSKFAA